MQFVIEFRFGQADPAKHHLQTPHLIKNNLLIIIWNFNNFKKYLMPGREMMKGLVDVIANYRLYRAES
jgi:hypothetical protein